MAWAQGTQLHVGELNKVFERDTLHEAPKSVAAGRANGGVDVLPGLQDFASCRNLGRGGVGISPDRVIAGQLCGDGAVAVPMRIDACGDRGLFAFSQADDDSDRRVIPGLFHALGPRHGSAIMTPDGAVRARLYGPDMRPRQVDLVSVAGDDLSFFWDDDPCPRATPACPTPFTGAMTGELNRLTAAVIGVSGTGSIVAEQAARLGFGRVVMIDFDRVEPRNLNRILNATSRDAAERALKVEMFADAIRSHRGDSVAVPIVASVATREAVLSAGTVDVLFCCVDTLEARQIADLVASSFLIPLVDMGVVIPMRRAGAGVAIGDVVGRVDFVQPGGSSLLDRGV
jgi:hypothetical protein